ncbi:hypothetical protein CYMTET_56772 [Cymbomonas tetramitiformis]|uniref:Uncharacterized protein n=1 Tax=Cymbomonas tetramitiformis TaxID=36881 RepID=A0AAE0BA95_9CHLO|nr:hypothetical protein CYMTET_56772 [Cymbomonas tetramitiformis]
MDAMFDIIQRMTPDDGVVFDRTKMDKKSLSAVTWLWDILQRHTRVFTYHIEFFKVEGCACIACAGGFIKPPRLPLEVFRELHPFPLPILGDNSADGKQHYKPFEDMWGSHPVEVLPEDLSKMTDEDTPFKAFFNMPYARQVIVCGECNKPRVLYAKTALTSNEKAVVIRATERSTYLCGGALFPEEDHPLQKRVVVRRAITCAAPVESIYYQKKTAAMPPCCCYCGVKGEDLYIDPALHTINKKGGAWKGVLARSQGPNIAAEVILKPWDQFAGLFPHEQLGAVIAAEIRRPLWIVTTWTLSKATTVAEALRIAPSKESMAVVRRLESIRSLLTKTIALRDLYSKASLHLVLYLFFIIVMMIQLRIQDSFLVSPHIGQ